jgi:hypothetical protein
LCRSANNYYPPRANPHDLQTYTSAIENILEVNTKRISNAVSVNQEVKDGGSLKEELS